MPIVDLGLLVVDFCAIAIAGQIPFILSTFGFCNFPRNWRAYDERLSIYLLCPSENKVSNAKDDLPLPETPEITMSCFFGMLIEIFLRLC